MGKLDSLAQKNLNRAWVCTCGNTYLNDYVEGYTHADNPICRRERIEPVVGKSYEIIKYNTKYWADGGFIVYNGPNTPKKNSYV